MEEVSGKYAGDGRDGRINPEQSSCFWNEITAFFACEGLYVCCLWEMDFVKLTYLRKTRKSLIFRQKNKWEHSI